MALVSVAWEVKERDCLFFIFVLMGNGWIYPFLFSLRCDGVSEGFVGGKRTRLCFLHSSAHGKCLNLSFLFYSLFGLMVLVRFRWEVNDWDCLFFILVLMGNAWIYFFFYSPFVVMVLVQVGWELKERDCLFFILVLMGNAWICHFFFIQSSVGWR